MTAAACDGYGVVRQGQGRAQDCPFRYPGQYEDVETGLYYNRFRYYDPEAGNYISQDPIRLRGGISLYNYVSNPGAYVDLYGLTDKCKLFQEKLAQVKKYSGILNGKTPAQVEAELLKKGFTKSFPQSATPGAIQHTVFTRTTKSGNATYILDYHPGATTAQTSIHGTPY